MAKKGSNSIKKVVTKKVTKTVVKKTNEDKTSLKSSKISNSSSPEIYEVKIGNQIWMTKNLNVTCFSNGDSIPICSTEEEWTASYETKKPAACYFNNDPKNGETLGLLYNWFAVNDKRGLAPKGWKVASVDDWKTLIGTNDMKKFGKSLKSKEIWPNGNKNDNSTGLSILPSGNRMFGEFSQANRITSIWTSTEGMSSNAMSIYLEDESGKIEIGSNYTDSGYAVRCIKK